MDRNTCKRIRKMAEYLDDERIANALNLPADVVRKVVNGQIDEIGETEPEKGALTRVHVVERARFVRNRTITAVSPGGGTGKTTLLTSLAALAALYCPNRRPVAIADFSEFPKAPTMLGLRLVEALIESDEVFPTAMTWPDGEVEQKEVLESLTLRHNVIQNLHILPGSVVAGEKPDGEKLAGIIKVLQRNFELVIIDLPKDPDTVIPLCDAILVVLTADYLSLEGMFQLMPVLERLSVQDRIIPVLNRVSGNALDPEQSRKLLRRFMIEVEFEGFIPEVPRPHFGIEKDRQPYVLSKADSLFATEVRQLLSVLCPDWGLAKKRDNGVVTSLLRRLIRS